MKIRTRDMTQIAILVAILAVFSQIAIPSPTGVPLTLQTLAITLIGYFAGWKKGLMVYAVYLLLGIIGIPVFANFKAGIQSLVGVTGGFLFGFIPFIILCGLNTRGSQKVLPIVLGICGLAICHLIGIVQFSTISGNSFSKTFMLVSFPYLIKDVISVICGFLLAKLIRKRIEF